MKTDVDRLLLISKLENTSILAKYFRNDFFSLSKPKVVYLRPFLSFLLFLKFRKQRFIYFGQKHVETGSNCSHELATFINYHMPKEISPISSRQ